jgi:hypothetical protein
VVGNELKNTYLDFLANVLSKKNKKCTYKGSNGSEREVGHHREEKTTMVWPYQKDVRGENTKTDYGMDTMGEIEKRTSKKNMNGRSTSSHDKEFRTRSMEKQRGMVFGFGKMATAVKKTRWIERKVHTYTVPYSAIVWIVINLKSAQHNTTTVPHSATV